jgi:hypothetical protein
VAGCCECGDEPSGSCATELVSYKFNKLERGTNFDIRRDLAGENLAQAKHISCLLALLSKILFS